MKVCLVSAPTANDFDDRDLAESEAVRIIAEHPPLGILCLAATLERAGIETEIVDLNRFYYDYLQSEERAGGELGFDQYAARRIEPLSFDMCGFSTICSSYPLTLRIANQLKGLRSDCSITLGGPQASVVDVETMKVFKSIDFVVRGEAERSFPALLDALESQHPLDAIQGITFRRGGNVVRNPNAPVIDNLDDLPTPAFHRYPYTDACKYIPLELGRGCPFACTFCSTNDFFRRRFRLKSPARLIEEMRQINKTYGIYSFDLVHDMFTVDRKKVVAFCEAVIESGEAFFWGCSARTDCIDDELIKLMAKAGCRGIFFGIETGSNRLQKIVKKDLDLDEARVRIKCADKYRIKTAVSLITGFPEETPNDLRDTVDFFMDSSRYDYADPQLCLLAPLAETPVESQHRDQLIFDDIISDMSFQGWRQDQADRDMIAEHRDIFTNFYSVPTPHLDRPYLKELREFILNGTAAFRWLFVGLHQQSKNILDVFDQWLAWRERKRGPYPEGNATLYYAHLDFRQDFIEFVKTHYLGTAGKAAPAISALAEYEAAFHFDNRRMQESGDDSPETEDPQDIGGLIEPNHVPVRANGIILTRLQADYRKIVKALRRKGRLDGVTPKEVLLVTRDTPNSGTEIVQPSDLSARLLELCDGVRTVGEIGSAFSKEMPSVDGIPAATASVLGLELLRRQGLIFITESAPSTGWQAGASGGERRAASPGI